MQAHFLLDLTQNHPCLSSDCLLFSISTDLKAGSHPERGHYPQLLCKDLLIVVLFDNGVPFSTQATTRFSNESKNVSNFVEVFHPLCQVILSGVR